MPLLFLVCAHIFMRKFLWLKNCMLRYLCSTATQMREVARSKTSGGVVGAKRLTISNGQRFLRGFKPLRLPIVPPLAPNMQVKDASTPNCNWRKSNYTMVCAQQTWLLPWMHLFLSHGKYFNLWSHKLTMITITTCIWQ